MDDEKETNRNSFPSAKMRHHWYWLPLSTLFLGLFSIALLTLSDQINDGQRSGFNLHDALAAMQLKAATFHLWFEENISGDETRNIEDHVWQRIEEAIRISQVILNGEDYGKYSDLKLLADPGHRKQIEEIQVHLQELKAVALQRYENPTAGGIGSALDEKFDDIYEEFENKARVLATDIDKGWNKNQIGLKRLFWGMFLIWTAIVLVMTARIWSQGLRRENVLKSPIPLLGMSTVMIFLTELMLMFFLPTLPLHSRWYAAIIDAGALALLLLPVFYFLWFRPMKDQLVRVSQKELMLQKEISEHRSTGQSLLQSEKKSRFLSSRVLTAQEKERRRISKELHDETGGGLAALKLRLNSVKRDLNGQVNVKQELEKSLQYIDQIMENVHRISKDLSPSVLEDLGFTAAVRWLCDTFQENNKINVTTEITDNLDALFSQNEKITAYRILQETLTNITKHAQAQNVSIAVKNHDGQVSFYVEDDGKGFNVKEALAREISQKGMGLETINERAQILGGFLHVWSEQGKGTRVSFSIPCETKVHVK